MKEYKIVTGFFQWNFGWRERTAERLNLLALDGWTILKVIGAWEFWGVPNFILVRERKK